jgi:hypothetical protein
LRSRSLDKLLSMFKNPKFSAIFGKEPASFGMFLGIFLGTFEYLLRFFNGSSKHYVRFLRAPLAGAFAALGFLFVPKQLRTSLSLFFFVRAIETLFRMANSFGWIYSIKYGEVFTMILACAEILWSFMFTPENLDPSYNRFISHHVAKSRDVIDAFSGLVDYSNSMEPSSLLNIQALSNINQSRLSKGLSPLDVRDLVDTSSLQDLICKIVHENDTSCTIHFLKFIYQSIFRTIPVYLPVYLIPLLIFRFQKLKAFPLQTLKSTGISIFQSAFFLSSFCGLAWYLMCMSRQYLGLYTGGRFLGHFVGLSGFTLLLEPKHRRIELALYALTQAIRTFVSYNVSNGLLPNIPNMDLYALIFSSMSIMSCYIEYPEILRPGYRTLLNYCFGSSKSSMKDSNPEESSVAVAVAVVPTK